MLIDKSSDERYARHCQEHPECADKGRVVIVPRSIWIPGFCGGGGDVKSVGVVYCETHDKKPEIRHGEPIYEDNLIDGEVTDVKPDPVV